MSVDLFTWGFLGKQGAFSFPLFAFSWLFIRCLILVIRTLLKGLLLLELHNKNSLASRLQYYFPCPQSLWDLKKKNDLSAALLVRNMERKLDDKKLSGIPPSSRRQNHMIVTMMRARKQANTASGME